MRRARRQLKGPLAIAGLALLAACSRTADAVPAEAPATSAPVAEPAPTPGRAAGEATCAAAPLAVRVVSVRRQSADSIRIELALANLATADAWSPDLPVAKAVRAAVDGLDDASVVSGDGRRRMFALRDASGDRVGPPPAVPVPGRPEAFWRLFPAAEGQVRLLLPGCASLAGLTVAPRPGPPEP